MKKLIIVLLAIQVAGSLWAQTYNKAGEFSANLLPKNYPHYQDEYMNEDVVNPEAWLNQAGLRAGFGTTDKLYFRREVPVLGKNPASLIQTAWKGERVNAQLLVWSADTLDQVRFKLKELKSPQGQVISSDHFRFDLVRYVVSNYPYAVKDAICGDSPYENGFMMPDRFEAFDRFDLPGKTLRPVWLTVDIPEGAVAGTYTGTIEVQSEKQTQVLNISIQVQNQVLPKPKDWKHRLDLWQNPWAVAWYNHLEPWSAEHKALLKQHLKPYAEAGGTFITTYAVHSPWSDNSFMIEGGMIEWIKQKNGSWSFDYKIFDEYVELAMECGIDEAITLYTAIPWGSRFRYMDESTGNYVVQTWEPESADFKKYWNIFLTDLEKHLKQKGWFDITYIGINENEMKHTLEAIKVVKAHSPHWKITYAGNWHTELDQLLDDYSYLYGLEPSLEQTSTRSKRGATSTYYVCCNPPVPNNFVFSPPIEGRWISWYTVAHGYDGFLRWAYDAWPEDPTRDARHGSWAAGDCYMIYPGGNSCIRFEKMREGIVDFEKIHIIRVKAAASNSSKVKSLLAELENHLKIFLTEKAFDETKIAADVQKGRELLDAISDELK